MPRGPRLVHCARKCSAEQQGCTECTEAGTRRIHTEREGRAAGKPRHCGHFTGNCPRQQVYQRTRSLSCALLAAGMVHPLSGITSRSYSTYQRATCRTCITAYLTCLGSLRAATSRIHLLRVNCGLMHKSTDMNSSTNDEVWLPIFEYQALSIKA